MDHFASNYLQLLKNIESKARQNGRDPSEIKLVVVTKNISWAKILPVYNTGCRNFGESYPQEAIVKMEQAPPNINWHFIGNLQKNKVQKVVGKFALIHSVDSVELAEKISKCSQKENLISDLLLEINMSREPTKHGFKPEATHEALEKIMGFPNIAILGCMTMAPYQASEVTARNLFAGLRKLRDNLSKEFSLPLVELSMGMSGDYQYAIAEGATILRIGSAIFGERT